VGIVHHTFDNVGKGTDQASLFDKAHNFAVAGTSTAKRHNVAADMPLFVASRTFPDPPNVQVDPIAGAFH
jgi:hypothetical protein